MSKNTATNKQSELLNEACALFGVTDQRRVDTVLRALGFKSPCSRCGGTGHYSFNRIDGTICYGCSGNKYCAAKLTREVLDQARIKVQSGELDAIRDKAKHKTVALQTIKVSAEAVRTFSKKIGRLYENAYRAAYHSEDDSSKTPIPQELFFAQQMNNSIIDAIREVESACKRSGIRVNTDRMSARIEELSEMSRTLHDELLRFLDRK